MKKWKLKILMNMMLEVENTFNVLNKILNGENYTEEDLEVLRMICKKNRKNKINKNSLEENKHLKESIT